MILSMRLLICLTALCAFGQNAPHIGDWKPDLSEARVSPKESCRDLHVLTGYDLSVVSADVAPAAAGENMEAPNRVTHRNSALKLGFAVTQTNTGHDAAREPRATFTVNSQKPIDYAFRSLHVTAEAAKRVASAYYGSRPDRMTAVAEHVQAPVPIRRQAQFNPDKVVRTRPPGPYPEVAKYKGRGSVDDAADFQCSVPN